MKKILAILTLSTLLITGLSINGLAQKKFNLDEYSHKILLSVGKQNITFGELKTAYDKNSVYKNVPFERITKDSALSFINSYAKYRAKVLSGKALGFDKDSGVIEEISKNRQILAESYLLESEVIEPAVNRYSDMRKIEKKIAIIITNFLPDGDTTEAYEKIQGALKEMANGESFEFAARKFSADSSTANNGGLLPVYITGLKLQRNIEDPIYALKVGEYTKTAIKTDYAYFVIKLIDEKPREFIKLSHILIPYYNDNADLGPVVKDTAAAIALVDSLVNVLNKGGNFAEIAKKWSGDKSNAEKGGELGIYSRSTGIMGTNENLNTELENTAFALKDKEISKPVKTIYGFHLIRRDSTITFSPDFEKSDIKSNYNRLYFQEDKQKFYDSLAVALCNYSLNAENYRAMLGSVDTTKTAFDTNFASTIPLELKHKTLYSLNKKDYSVGWFVNQLIATPVLKMTPTNNDGFTKAIKKLIEPIVLETATKNIDKSHPDFNSIVAEFADGIVLFKAEQVNVWDKLRFDSARAKKYYDTTKMNLRKSATYDISEIYILTKDKADEAYKDIKSGKYTFDTAAFLFTQRANYRDKYGRFPNLDSTHTFAKFVTEKNLKVGDYTEPFKFDNGYSIIRLNAQQPARRKTYEEALIDFSGPMQAEYQKILEEQWMSNITKENKIIINEKLLNEIYSK
ncbi:MAG: peptidylprolyl isomerase [Ignavibacteria bacterium]|jgi:peptidyl-prolyl cis-trans isomerase SurA|nr:peptidylprolyl isomerase [Ignavibacteria bacterium]